MSIAPKIDEEFRSLLPALTHDQRAGLERDIIESPFGISSPLTVWAEEGILLDGHNRLEIALLHGLPFSTQDRSFPSREAAVEWIFKNQRDRRNLTPDQLFMAMGRHYNRKKGPRGGDHRSEEASSKKCNKVAIPGATAKELAGDYGVAFQTVINAGKFAAAVDTLRAVDPDIEAKVLTGKGPTRKAVIAAAEAIAEPETAKALLSGGRPAPAPLDAPKSKATNAAPSDGMRIARAAAGKLNEIRIDDLERSEAFAFMRRWIDAHEA